MPPFYLGKTILTRNIGYADIQIKGEEAQAAGAVSINYGVFINTIVSFIIIAVVVFFLVVRPITQMRARQQAAEAAPPPNTKECPYCYSTIPIKATRCPNCTSELKPS
jgi:large conductance mechanosensitive channel